MCYNIGMDERFINELLDYTLPKQRAEYGGFTFPRSFIAEMFIGVLERYRARLTMQGINPALYGVPAPDIIRYICGYHYAFTGGMDEKTRIAATHDESYRARLVADVAESIFILENIKTSAKRIINEYNPVYCRFNILLDYLLTVGLKGNAACKERTSKAVYKLFETAFLKLKGIMMLAAKGLEKEAIVVWRSLHELECVISVLCKYGKNTIEEFETFDRFSDPEHMDEKTRADYDEKTKAFGINLKNANEVDHFENYGWLGAVPDLQLTKWNLNFRYLEDLAGLSDKYKEYQVACDASHMNAKILKWDKRRVLEFAVKRCFNSNLLLVNKFTEFLSADGATIDRKYVGKAIGDLKNVIDVFFTEQV